MAREETLLDKPALAPGASHGIAARPSNLISKVAHVLKWFEMNREKK